MGRISPHTTISLTLDGGTRPKGGFTILELIVLLVALTVVASVGIPAYFGRPSVTLEGAASLLAKDLREVQSRAALYEEELWLRFDEDGTGYRVTDRSGEPLVSPYGVGPYLRDYPIDAVFRGVNIANVTPAEPGSVVFSPEGMPRDSVSVIVEYQGEQREVTIRERSGMIAIEGEIVK